MSAIASTPFCSGSSDDSVECLMVLTVRRRGRGQRTRAPRTRASCTQFYRTTRRHSAMSVSLSTPVKNRSAISSSPSTLVRTSASVFQVSLYRAVHLQQVFIVHDISTTAQLSQRKRRHTECALMCRHLWPRCIQPHAKIIVLCFR